MAKQKWLSVIGIEEDGLSGLCTDARALVDAADVVFGGKRHLAMLNSQKARQIEWQVPFANSLREIESLRGKNVVVLATGDPQWFGIGAMLVRKFDPREMSIIPARSAFSLAASRLGWSLATSQTITLHGRDFANLARFVFPRARLLVLSNDGTTPAKVAGHLEACGFGQSKITVLEHLGGTAEKVRSSMAEDFDLANIAGLNVVAIECVAGPDAVWLPMCAGLPDEAFCHDGQLTKSVVRAATLAALRPYPGALLWDVGAGCGSVAIEWMRAAPNARALAVESNTSRCQLIVKNSANLGVPGVKLVKGHAPDILLELSRPDAVFIGGGLTMDGMFEICWRALLPAGVLVANGVTLEGETMLINLHAKHGGQLLRISVEQAAPMGKFNGWQQARPVTQLRLVKSGEAE